MADDTPRSDGASAASPDESSAPSEDDSGLSEDDSGLSDDDATPSDDDSAPSETASAVASDEQPPGSNSPRDRHVTVPTHVYKRVTVFSTLFAVVAVVAGFLLLDSATDRATLELSEVDPLVALAGLACIVLGAVTYAFSTRFQAEGMGNAKDESDESSNNG